MSFGAVLFHWLQAYVMELAVSAVMVYLPQTEVVVKETQMLKARPQLTEHSCLEMASCVPVSRHGLETAPVMVLSERAGVVEEVPVNELGETTEAQAPTVDDKQADATGEAASSPTEQEDPVKAVTTPKPTAEVVPDEDASAEIVAKATGFDINGAVNQYRAGNNMSQLTNLSDLCSVAQQRAGEVEVNFNHDGFSESMSGLGYERIGENIWSGSTVTSEAVISSWDGSQGHKENLLGDWVYGCGARSGAVVVYLFMK